MLLSVVLQFPFCCRVNATKGPKVSRYCSSGHKAWMRTELYEFIIPASSIVEAKIVYRCAEGFVCDTGSVSLATPR